jgi:hypothetical protein
MHCSGDWGRRWIFVYIEYKSAGQVKGWGDLIRTTGKKPCTLYTLCWGGEGEKTTENETVYTGYPTLCKRMTQHIYCVQYDVLTFMSDDANKHGQST